jgi:hypothetical protein
MEEYAGIVTKEAAIMSKTERALRIIPAFMNKFRFARVILSA